MPEGESRSADPTSLPEVGYYYPEPFWRGSESGWVKTLLLFFDQVAILLPEYMYGRHHQADLTLTEPLEDRGLLRILRPESFVDKEVTDALADAMAYLLEAGAFDHLERDGYFAELSRSRLGWNADVELSGLLIEELKRRGLAEDSQDGVSVPLHRTVRTTILVLLSQLSRTAGKRQGLDLHPITSDEERIRDLIATLKLADVATAGEIIALDLETVTVNLEDIPLDEVLGFRDEHRDEHRAYARSVRRTLIELSAVPSDERPRVLADRREELADQADQLRRFARRQWRQPLARFGLGGAGAALNAGGREPSWCATRCVQRHPRCQRQGAAERVLLPLHGRTFPQRVPRLTEPNARQSAGAMGRR